MINKTTSICLAHNLTYYPFQGGDCFQIEDGKITNMFWIRNVSGEIYLEVVKK